MSDRISGETFYFLWPGGGKAPFSPSPLESIVTSFAASEGAGEGRGGLSLLASCIQAARKESRATRGTPMPIDARILAMMRVSEAFLITEGDLRAAIDLPVSAGTRDLRLVHPDEGVRREAESLAERLDLLHVAADLWWTMRVLGNAFLLPVVEGKALSGVVLLNPKRVGLQALPGVGGSAAQYHLDGPAQRTPALDALVQSVTQSPSALYLPAVWEWNERWEERASFILPPGSFFHLRQRELPFKLWGIPPLMGAARSITSRMALEEMLRGVMEGVRGQLIVITIQDPAPGEVEHLASLLRDHRADRTGVLVWGRPLTVQQVMPTGVDSLMAPEALLRLTLDIFRKLGISLRLVGGEPPGTAVRGTDPQVEMDIFLERVEAEKREVERALGWLLAHHAAGPAWRERPPRVRLADPKAKVERMVESVILPLIGSGLLSGTTALEETGYDVEQEIARKRREMEDWSLWTPKATFAQAVFRTRFPERGPSPTPETPEEGDEGPEETLE